MAKAPVVTELPLQNVRFLFGTMVDLRMLPQVLEQTGNAEVGEFKLVAHFPADEKAANNEAGYLARHKGFRGGDYNTYHGDPYTLDEVIWDATGRAGVHLVTKTKYGAVVEFPTIPDKNDSAELMLIVSEYVESIKTPPLIVRCSGFGGSISPLGNKKYQLNLTTGATKCPTSIKDHVPKKYHAEDTEIIPHVGGAYIMNAEDLSPAEQSLIANTIVNQMRGYYRTGVIGTEPVIGAFPNGPMSISKRTPEAKQNFFREPAVQDEDGFWNKGPNRWQAHKIAKGVAYDRLERARGIGALTPGYRHRGSSGKFRRNPFIFGAEEMTREEINEAARSVADEWHPAGKAKSCCFCSSTPAYPTQYGTMCEPCANTFGTIVETHFAPGRQNPAGFTPSYNAEMVDGTPTQFVKLDDDAKEVVISPKDRMAHWIGSHTEPGREGDLFSLDAEDFAAERKLMCAEHDDYFNACGCGSKNAAEETWTEEMICVKCASPFMECQCERCPQCQKFWVDEGPASNCTDCYSCAACCDCHNSGAEEIPVWNDGIVEWETSGPMSPTGSGYSSASVPPTGVMAGPGDTFLNYSNAQNYLVESSGGLWGAEDEEGTTPVMPPHEFGQPVHWQPYEERITALKRQRAEEFAAMARIDPKNATDVKNVVSALKKRYNRIKIDRTEYITNRIGSSNKYHVFVFTNRGVFNGYGRIGKTMTIFGPMSESQGHTKLNRKHRQGYKETF